MDPKTRRQAAGLEWDSNRLRQQFEVFAVAGTEHAEIAPIESRDARDVQPLRDGHDAAVYDVKSGAFILPGNLVDPCQVSLNSRDKPDKAMVEEIKEIKAVCIAQVAPEQEADFWQYQIRHEYRFRPIRCEIVRFRVMNCADVIQRD